MEKGARARVGSPVSCPLGQNPIHPEISLIVFFSFNRMRDVQADFAEFLPQRLAGDPQQPRCLTLTPLCVVQDERQKGSIHFAMNFRVQIRSIGTQPLMNQCSQAQVPLLNRRPG